MRHALVSSKIVDLGVGPKFRLVAQGKWVESRPILFVTAGISLTVAGKYDAIVVTEDDEVFVVDYKTTTLDDHALAKFASQLMSYVTAIELPKLQRTGLPAYVDRTAILVFDPAHFAFNPKTKNCGLFGRTRWVELPRDQDAFNALMESIAQLLAHPTPPRSGPACGRAPPATSARCAFLQRRRPRAHDGARPMMSPDYDEKSVTQRIYEFVLRAGHPVRAREIAAAVGATSLSSVTYALSRLVREGNLLRTGYGEYATPSEAQAVPDATPLDPFRNDRRLGAIFESIRGSLSFEDLSFLYNVVLSARRLAPDLFRLQASQAQASDEQ